MTAAQYLTPALFITGAPGSGKTALAKEVSELFWHAGEPHAFVDLDELCRGRLPEATADFQLDLALENLQAVWMNFQARGAQRLVMARILQSRHEFERVVAALPECDVMLCLVQVDEATMLARLARREAGTAHAFLRAVAPVLRSRLARADLPGFCVNNGAETRIPDLARTVLGRLGWSTDAGQSEC